MSASAAPAAVSGTAARVDSALVGFFVGAFLLPWTVWGSKLAEQHGWIGWHLPGGVALWTLLPVTVGAAASTGRREALADLWRRLTRWRVPAQWYAAAVGVPVALGLIATGAGAVLGGSAHLGQTLALPAAVAYLLYGTGLFLLTEEAAWRGFALPRLMARRSPLGASLVLGVIWALWHLPIFGLAGESDSTIPYGGFALMTVATSVILAWLYTGSGGSVLLCAVFHAVTDATYSYLGVVGRDHHAFWVAVALEVMLATVLVVRGGPSLVAGRRR